MYVYTFFTHLVLIWAPFILGWIRAWCVAWLVSYGDICQGPRRTTAYWAIQVRLLIHRLSEIIFLYWIMFNAPFLILTIFFLENQHLKKNIEKCPFTYWLNGRWFLQIVDGDSGNLYILYSLVLIFFLKCGGGVMFFLHFMLFQTFLEKQNSGNKKNIYNLKKLKKNFFWFLWGGDGVGFWTCWREISSDRVAFFWLFLKNNSRTPWSITVTVLHVVQ